MDFAVVQAPSVNEGRSTFCTGLDFNSHVLFIHGSGSKVMVFDDQFQLVQIIRTASSLGYIQAVAFNSVDMMIAIGYDKQIELYEIHHPKIAADETDNESLDDDGIDNRSCEKHEWRRSASVSVSFKVMSLAWSSNEILAAGGSSIALFEPTRTSESPTSFNSSTENAHHLNEHPFSTAWTPSKLQSLPTGVLIDRLDFSPDGNFLVAQDSRDCSGILKVWSFDHSCFGESHVLSSLAHVLRPAYKAKLESLRAAEGGRFVPLDHGEMIVDFSWWPGSILTDGSPSVLLTWTVEGIFSVWMSDSVPEGFIFNLCHTFDAKAAYWLTSEDPGVASLAVINRLNEYFTLNIYNLLRCKERLIRTEMVASDFDYGFNVELFSLYDFPWIADSRFLVVAIRSGSDHGVIQVFEMIGENGRSQVLETFSWSVAPEPSFPLQMVSPYNLMGASVFPRTPSILDVCLLGEGGCYIMDCAKVLNFDGEIISLQWVPEGHAFVTTNHTSCYAICFQSDDLLAEEKRVKIFSRPGEEMVFVGAISHLSLATFHEKGQRRVVSYKIDFEEGVVVDGPDVLYSFVEEPGFIQTLDLNNHPFIIYSSSNYQNWYLIVDGLKRPIYSHQRPVLLARTSIYGDLALVSPISDSVHSITIVTPASKDQPGSGKHFGELDKVLAIKWVVVDPQHQIRHLIVCTVSGIVVFVSSFQADHGFQESWHALDLCAFPSFLSPPLPHSLNSSWKTTISCNRNFDIWLSIDDFIVMFAPLDESPMWDGLANALIPGVECEGQFLFYTFCYSVLTASELSQRVQEISSLFEVTEESDDVSQSISPESNDYSELFDDFGLDSNSDSEEDVADDRAVDNSKETVAVYPWLPSVSQSISLIKRLSSGLDDAGLKFMALNYIENGLGLDLQGFPFLCAYLSDAQNLLVSESLDLIVGKLSWNDFKRIGFAVWLKNASALAQLVEQMARYEVTNNQSSIEEVSLFYLLLDKPRALQALWKTSTSSSNNHQMATFLSKDFTNESARLAASKNGFAALGKQKYRLAIAFFLLAGSLEDAVQVAVERIGDWWLGLLIARMGSGGGWFYEKHLDKVDLKCVKGVLGSLLVDKPDLINTVKSHLTDHPDLILAVSKLRHSSPVDNEDVVMRGSRTMLECGALEPAIAALQWYPERFGFELLTYQMVQRRWHHSRSQNK